MVERGEKGCETSGEGVFLSVSSLFHDVDETRKIPDTLRGFGQPSVKKKCLIKARPREEPKNPIEYLTQKNFCRGYASGRGYDIQPKNHEYKEWLQFVPTVCNYRVYHPTSKKKPAGADEKTNLRIETSLQAAIPLCRILFLQQAGADMQSAVPVCRIVVQFMLVGTRHTSISVIFWN